MTSVRPNDERRCPLCLATKLQHRQTFACSDLVEIYGAQLSDTIRAELTGVEFLEFLCCLTCDLRFFSPQIAGSSRLYDVLQGSESYYQADKPEFDYARGKIARGDDVLEVGCGAGAFGASIQSRSYTGLELTASAAERARSLGLHVREETIEQHGLLNPAAYDVVCAFQVLEHIAQPHSFISSCLSALRPGGRLILSIPSADSFAGDLPNHALDLPPHHMTRWSDRCLAGLSSIFPVSVEAIWHEPLRPVHHRMYVQSRLYRAYRRLIGAEPLPVDTSFVGRLSQSLFGKLSKVLRSGWKLSQQRGICVSVVLRKPA